MSQTAYKEKLSRAEPQSSALDLVGISPMKMSPNRHFNRDRIDMSSLKEFEIEEEEQDENLAEKIVRVKIEEAKEELDGEFRKNDEKVEDILDPKRKKKKN